MTKIKQLKKNHEIQQKNFNVNHMMVMMMNCEINFSCKTLTQSTPPHNNGKNDVNDERKSGFASMKFIIVTLKMKK